MLDPTVSGFAGRLAEFEELKESEESEKSKTLSDFLGTTHFIGIGGAGMSVLAEMLIGNGVKVSGSDREANEKTARLQALGAKVFIGQQESNVAGAQTVVWSSAIKDDNPEIIAARRQESTLAHRSDILALLLSQKQSVTVAGAHGKTSTSAMIAQILVSAGKGSLADPSYAIGGSIRTAEGTVDGGHYGTGSVMVAEADESDGSFEKYHPSIAVITNVEPDHLDHYGNATAFSQAFVDHAHHATDHVVICADDKGALEVLRSLSPQAGKNAVAYSTQDAASLGNLNGATLVQIRETQTDNFAQDAEKQDEESAEQFTLSIPSELLGTDTANLEIPVHLRVPGIHNARNAAAAIMSAILLGMDAHEACEAVFEFRGAARRFETRAIVKNVQIIDDYAHHPTEIAALLTAARRRFPNSTIRVLFQPHLFSRTYFFASQFAQALVLADNVTVTGIYPAREKQEDWPQVSPNTIVAAFTGNSKKANTSTNTADTNYAKNSKNASGSCIMRSIADMEEAARTIAREAQPGDVIFTVGAGSITSMANVIAQELELKDPTA